MNENTQTNHHRRSIRLNGYDYSQPGAYFVTMVTQNRAEIFGQVVDGEMKLSALGQIVHDEWMRSIGIRKEIQLHDDEFVIMPNHLHGIVWIVNPVGADGVRPETIEPNTQGARRAPLQCPQQEPVGANCVRPETINPNTQGARRAPLPRPQLSPKSLGSFISGFKASVTSRARRELNMLNVWQRNYYDHVIRGEGEFQKIWNYIDDNPHRWQEDQLHPSHQ